MLKNSSPVSVQSCETLCHQVGLVSGLVTINISNFGRILSGFRKTCITLQGCMLVRNNNTKLFQELSGIAIQPSTVLPLRVNCGNGIVWVIVATGLCICGKARCKLWRTVRSMSLLLSKAREDLVELYFCCCPSESSHTLGAWTKLLCVHLGSCLCRSWRMPTICSLTAVDNYLY